MKLFLQRPWQSNAFFKKILWWSIETFFMKTLVEQGNLFNNWFHWNNVYERELIKIIAKAYLNNLTTKEGVCW